MFEELMCTLCKRQYANEGDLVPRLIPETGHTFCTKCLNIELQKDPTQPFRSPEDGEVSHNSSIFSSLNLIIVSNAPEEHLLRITLRTLR